MSTKSDIATSNLNVIEAYQAEVSKLQGDIDEAKARVEKLHQAQSLVEESFVARMVADGWQRFVYISSYYGNHSERGGGDVEQVFLFHPSIDISRWEEANFGHGDHSRNKDNEEFGAWMNGIDWNHVVKLFVGPLVG